MPSTSCWLRWKKAFSKKDRALEPPVFAARISRRFGKDSHSRLTVERQNATTPEQKYTFGGVKAAPAPGYLQALAERGRRALRVHLGSDVNAGLETLRAAVQKAPAWFLGGGEPEFLLFHG
ncbi:MAG TPA: hypothetical protein VN901_06650 [Candidatus Acidoferrales bacterium]|nr:hypothetical protein [Candidatus Acidoferrales bacterium]